MIGERLLEPDETFTVTLSNADAAIGDAVGVGTIVDDDYTFAPLRYDLGPAGSAVETDFVLVTQGDSRWSGLVGAGSLSRGRPAPRLLRPERDRMARG